MVELVKSRMFGTALMVWASFFPLMMLLDNRSLFTMVGSMTFTVSTAVIIAYWPAMRDAIRHGPDNLDFVDFLTLGIMCTWFATSARFALITGYRWWTEAPRADLEIWPIAFLQFVNLTGGILHLSARRVIKNNIPRSSWPTILMSIGTGIALGAILILTRGEFNG